MYLPTYLRFFVCSSCRPRMQTSSCGSQREQLASASRFIADTILSVQAVPVVALCCLASDRSRVNGRARLLLFCFSRNTSSINRPDCSKKDTAKSYSSNKQTHGRHAMMATASPLKQSTRRNDSQSGPSRVLGEAAAASAATSTPTRSNSKGKQRAVFCDVVVEDTQCIEGHWTIPFSGLTGSRALTGHLAETEIAQAYRRYCLV